MKRVILDMCNGLMEMSIMNTLTNSGNFEVYSIRRNREKNGTQEIADIALLEVAYNSGFTIEENLSKVSALHNIMPECKVLLICDENSVTELTRKVAQSKKDGLIDEFIYSTVSESYLLAIMEAM